MTILRPTASYGHKIDVKAFKKVEQICYGSRYFGQSCSLQN
jgi:hypothetical protein